MESLLGRMKALDFCNLEGRRYVQESMLKLTSMINSHSLGVVPQIETKLINDLSEFIQMELRQNNFAVNESCAEEVLEYVVTLEAISKPIPSDWKLISNRRKQIKSVNKLSPDIESSYDETIVIGSSVNIAKVIEDLDFSDINSW